MVSRVSNVLQPSNSRHIRMERYIRRHIKLERCLQNDKDTNHTYP
ncbi:hypothetical protein Golob_024247 [Gossypium lobatum]|uniref:Uncharacterized protein n=1 Tax=Gossypium lobatum TaxID=34289 RepID=A0A7J8NES4_9ROSI|nr:hypothetical protein [Gossypium lobatum]